MVHVAYNPTARLLCTKCRKQTAHVMTNFSNNPVSALTLFYECQECGETKKIFDLNALPELKVQSNTGEGQPKQTVQEAPKPAVPVEKVQQAPQPINR